MSKHGNYINDKGVLTYLRLILKKVTSLGSTWKFDQWTSARNNATNAWNSNSGNGNVNTNNVFNRYRALSARLLESPDLSDDIIQDYLDAEALCFSNKHDSLEANRVHYTPSELYKLILRVVSNTWTQGTSIVFTVTYPTNREIWASEYTDRIIHHYVGDDLTELTELIHSENNNVSHGNRIGHSAFTASQQIRTNMKLKPNGVVVKRDLSGFFMSINREKVTELILNRYQGRKARLIKKLIMYNPTDNCISHSSEAELSKIPKNKSLFHAKKGCGLPIGNYYSQLVANAYLQSVDALAMTDKWKDKIGYTRFVDDICIITDNMSIANEFFIEVESKLDELGLKLNRKKKYQQPIKNGVSFCGYTIHSDRIYINNRTINNCIYKVKTAPEGLNGAKKLVTTLNSYYGFFGHCRSLKIQVKIAKLVLDKYKEYIKIKLRGNQLVFSLSPQYQYKMISKRFMTEFINKLDLVL